MYYIDVFLEDFIMKTLEDFEQYFASDLAAIDEELEKSKEYSKMIDDELNKIKQAIEASGGYMKGSQHYLIEHIKNAVALQTQRQSLRKDKFTIRKAIIDYANKNESEKSETFDIQSAINELLASTKNNSYAQVITSENDDEYIENILKNEK